MFFGQIFNQEVFILYHFIEESPVQGALYCFTQYSKIIIFRGLMKAYSQILIFLHIGISLPFTDEFHVHILLFVLLLPSLNKTLKIDAYCLWDTNLVLVCFSGRCWMLIISRGSYRAFQWPFPSSRCALFSLYMSNVDDC